MMISSAETPLSMAMRLSAEVATRADAADQEAKLPAEDVQALRDSGYLQLSVPREYGGMGLPLRDCVAAQLELAQGSASTAMVAGMHMHLFGNVSENRPWPESMFEWMCRDAVAGGLYNTLASEPSLGSPSRGAFFATTATLDGDEWVVNGHKTWTTGGRHLTQMVVRLSLGEEPGAILIPGDAAGILWKDTWSDSLSLRASDSHDVYFENVRVPAGHLLERGKRDQNTPNAWFPMVMASVYLGAALAARSAVIRYALERVPTALGKPIATLPKIQRQIGEIDLMLQAARALLFEVASEWTGDERSRGLFPRVAAAKHLVTETANQVTDKALQIAGGASLTRDLPLERHFRDTRAGLMQPPSGDAALELIGQGAIQRFQQA